MKRIVHGIMLSVALVLSMLSQTATWATLSSENSRQIWVIYASSTPTSFQDTLPYEWIRYLSGVTPTFKKALSLSTNIDDYKNVSMIFYAGVSKFTRLSMSQIQTLKLYVSSGGSLFIGGHADVITNAWYGTQSTGSKSPSGFKFPANPALDLTTIFGNYSVPADIFPRYLSEGYFDDRNLPSTIVPVIVNNTARSEPLVYAGVEGKGRVVLVPNNWLYSFARISPFVHSPILLHLIDYLVPEDSGDAPRLVRADRQYVAFRIDDITKMSLDKIKSTNAVFRSYGITKVTYGIILNDPTTQLRNEIDSMASSEKAIHGDSTGHTSSSSYDYTTAYKRIGGASEFIQYYYGVAPKMYLAPYSGSPNSDVLQALDDLNLAWCGELSEDRYYDYALNLHPSGVAITSALSRLDVLSETSFWNALIMFEYVRLLDSMPFLVLLHPSSTNTHLDRLLRYFRDYRNVEYVTFSEALNKAYRTISASNAFKSVSGSRFFIKKYKWSVNPYGADVQLTLNTTGRVNIRFNDTIIFATINGEWLNSFQGKILYLPLLDANRSYSIHVDFGVPPQNPPVALFRYSPSTPAAGQTITFDASSSYDLGGQIVSYEWDFGDGTKETGVSPTHAYAVSGDYIVTLNTTDNEGLSTTAETTITASSPPIGANSGNALAVPGQLIFFQINITITNYGDPTVFTIKNVTFSGRYSDWASTAQNLPRQKTITGMGYMLVLLKANVPLNADLGINVDIPYSIEIESQYATQTVEATLSFNISNELPG